MPGVYKVVGIEVLVVKAAEIPDFAHHGNQIPQILIKIAPEFICIRTDKMCADNNGQLCAIFVATAFYAL